MPDSEPESPSSDPKIIVDDDWKEQVQKEKEQLRDDAMSPAADSANDAEPPDQMPEATLDVHLTMLFTQCMGALGQVPGPDGHPGELNKPYAKFFIDTVEMLQQKTEGNLSDDEEKMFSEMLHAMRMAYVSIK